MGPLDIAWARDTLGGAHVCVRWLGAAGFVLQHGEHSLLIDPYLTRASWAKCVAGPVRSDLDVLKRYIQRADGIVVGHTHFDHALDVPDLALMTGAKVFGSRSASALCRARGVPPERIEIVEREPGSLPIEREAGPFRLRFFPSAHSPLVMGSVPFPGEIADCSDVPMRIGDYRCGAVFGVEIRVANRVLFHFGSAELVESNLDTSHVDLLLMCAAGWTTTPNLPERIGRVFAPDAILLSHWDNFLRPIDRPPRPLPALKLPHLVERLDRALRGVRIGTLPLLGEVWL
jgi:hypothetical protein